MRVKKLIMLILIAIVSLSFNVKVEADTAPKITSSSIDESSGAKYMSVEIEIIIPDGVLEDSIHIQKFNQISLVQEDGERFLYENIALNGEDESGNRQALKIEDYTITVDSDGNKVLKLNGTYDLTETSVLPKNFIVGYSGAYDDELDNWRQLKSDDVIKTSTEVTEEIKETIGREEDVEEEENKNLYFVKTLERNPYIIEYKGDVPIEFAINVNDGGQEGTYQIEWLENEKKIIFHFLGDSKRVGWVKEHEGSEEYNQVGVEPVNLVKVAHITSESKPIYVIKEKKIEKTVESDDLKLNNGFPPISVTSYVQKPNVYVFVNMNQGSGVGTDFIKKITYEFCGYEEPEQTAGWLETLLTRILEVVGDTVLTVIQGFLGADLTIDRIIFNEYEPVVIDLEGGRGIVAKAAGALESVYNSFTTIAASVFLIALLYIGVKILLGVGGPGQSKYLQQITSWLIGLVLLFVGPMFFKYIPKIVNTLVDIIADEKEVNYTYYNMDIEMLKRLGFTKDEIEDLIGTNGEDSRTVWIEVLEKQKNKMELYLDELEIQAKQTYATAKKDVQDAIVAEVWANTSDPIIYKLRDDPTTIEYLADDLTDTFVKAAVENGGELSRADAKFIGLRLG